MSPALPEDSMLLTLPFGGAVLQMIGVNRVEIDAIIEEKRKKYMEKYEGDEFDFLDAFNNRLPSVLEDGKENSADSSKIDGGEDSSIDNNNVNNAAAADNELIILRPASSGVLEDPTISIDILEENRIMAPPAVAPVEMKDLKIIEAPRLECELAYDSDGR